VVVVTRHTSHVTRHMSHVKGTLLAIALPDDYKRDPLLTNWTKPSYNPIINNTQVKTSSKNINPKPPIPNPQPPPSPTPKL